jgi:hypothetical protein
VKASVAIPKTSAGPFLLQWTIAAYPSYSKLHFDFTIDFLEIEMYIMRKDGACNRDLLGSGRMPLDRVVVEASHKRAP